MHQKQELGRNGENIASKVLENKNYKILERNFRCRQGEIDIIAYDEATKEIVFVEVKTRSNLCFGKPREAVDNQKKKQLYKAAKYYLYKKI